MMISLVRFSHLTLLAVLLGACAGGGTTTLNNASGVNSLEIDPTNPSVAKGTSTQLSATALYSGTSPGDVSTDLTWSSSDPSVATVDSSGKIIAVGTGTATISGVCAVTSVCGSASATIKVTVTPASLTSIALTPPAPRMAPGTSQSFTATGTFSDNSTQNLSADLTWTSSNPAAATVSSSGLVSSVGAGSATITATCKVASVCGALAGNATVTVTSASLVSIALTPPAPSMAPGTSQSFIATGTFSDDSTQNLSADLTWTSSNPAAATVSSSGLVTAVGGGSAIITATCSVASVCGSVAGSTTVSVTAATLVSIAVSPAAPSVALAANETFAATGTYSDNSTQNLTTRVTWNSGTPAVATISNAAGTAGVAHPVAAGTTQITAALGGVTSSAVTLTVTSATLVSIALTPPAPSMAPGTSQPFTATGTFSDDSTQNLSADLTWTSSNPAAATVTSNGVVTAVGSGSATITATCSVASVCGSLAGTATVTVTTATLVSIAITPPAPSVALGTNETFTATGTYSDSSTQNLTTQVTWTSATPAIATISNAAGTAGVAHPVATGTTRITAVLGSVASPAVTFTVTAATLVSIALTPPAPTLAPGTSQPFTATGTFSDNSTQNLSTDLTWTSSNPAAATVSSSGVVSAVGGGSTTITATCSVASVCGSLAGSATVTVTTATLVSIAVTPPAPSIALGTNETFTATGTYSDSSTQNLSTQVTWTSGTPAVATISNAAGTAGVAHPVATGTTPITAVLGSVASPAVTFTVTAATLVSIAITPTGPSIPVSGSGQFVATGTYSDTSTQVLTSQVTWTSATTGVATISNAAGTAGLAHPVAAGTTQITAALGSVSAPGVTLTVTVATLVSIAITPTGPSIPVAGTEQFVATGTYSDSSTQVLTTTVTWASDTSSVAAISNASNYQGLASGLQAGSSSITATAGAVASPPVTLTVTAQMESVLYSFGSGVSEGQTPYDALVQGTDGNFYGTTHDGGTHSGGTVFKVTPAGVETVLYSFGAGSDGTHSWAGLVQGTDGNFYGTTESGGANGNAGTVFKITPAGVETVLWSFGSGGDGTHPYAGLIQGTDGNFYGTTLTGGANAGGTVFKITPAGVETVLLSFGSGGDGTNPSAGLIQGNDGNFYGTTQNGGSNGDGTVFKMTPAGVETVLYSFGTADGDGTNPYGGLVQGIDGNFYGTTPNGGTGFGSVFVLTPAGVETVLWMFGSGSDGQNPSAGLIQGADGDFYGTTTQGGANVSGTIYKITPAGVETVLWSFGGGGGLDGAVPYGGLIQGTDGNFYATTSTGGANSFGTVFKF